MRKLKKKLRYRIDFVDTELKIKSSWQTNDVLITVDFEPNLSNVARKEVHYSRVKLELHAPSEVKPKKKRKKKIKNGRKKSK